jgi:hypothetical protein
MKLTPRASASTWAKCLRRLGFTRPKPHSICWRRPPPAETRFTSCHQTQAAIKRMLLQGVLSQTCATTPLRYNAQDPPPHTSVSETIITSKPPSSLVVAFTFSAHLTASSSASSSFLPCAATLLEIHVILAKASEQGNQATCCKRT